MKVLLDTNALLIPFEFGLNPYQGVKDLIPGAELFTLEACIEELKRVKPKSWEDIVSLALQGGVKVLPLCTQGSADDLILETAKSEGMIVLTQDSFLRKRLLKSGLRVILMRRKKTFVIMG